MKLLVISAGTSTPSSTRLLGDGLAEATASALTAAGESVEVEQLELRLLAVELAHQLTSRIAGAKLSAAFESVQQATAVIVVTPVFNGSYSGLFKMFFDAIDETALEGKPVLLAAAGGTARHSLVIEHALVPLFYYLNAVVAPHSVFAATKDWGGAKLGRRIEAAGTGFADLIRRTPQPAVEAPLLDFTELLQG